METFEPDTSGLSLFYTVIDSRKNIIGAADSAIVPYFAGYTIFSTRKKKTGETLWDIWSDSGSACCIFRNNTCKRILLFPNTPEVSRLISLRCDALLQRKSHNRWKDGEGNLIVRKHGVHIVSLYYELKSE